MNSICCVIAVFTFLCIQSEATATLLNADYSDDDLVAEETRSFAQASSSAKAGASASASAGDVGGFGSEQELGRFRRFRPFHPFRPFRPFGGFRHFGPFGGFGRPPPFGQPYNNYGPPPPHHGPMQRQPDYEDSDYEEPHGEEPDYEEHQPPMRNQYGHGKNKIPPPQMQPKQPFGNNNQGPKQPPQGNTPFQQPPVPVPAPIPSRVPVPTVRPMPVINPVPQEVIPTARPTSLPASSVVPESTSTTTEEPFYDIDVRVDD